MAKALPERSQVTKPYSFLKLKVKPRLSAKFLTEYHNLSNQIRKATKFFALTTLFFIAELLVNL